VKRITTGDRSEIRNWQEPHSSAAREEGEGGWRLNRQKERRNSQSEGWQEWGYFAVRFDKGKHDGQGTQAESPKGKIKIKRERERKLLASGEMREQVLASGKRLVAILGSSLISSPCL
jgi:hypothetical protein